MQIVYISFLAPQWHNCTKSWNNNNLQILNTKQLTLIKVLDKTQTLSLSNLWTLFKHLGDRLLSETIESLMPKAIFRLNM